MSQQLSIFSTGILCWHCNNDPGTKESNAYHWNGFFDQDEKIKVCNLCKTHHYNFKLKGTNAGKYSEIPVFVKQNQHNKK